MSSHPDIYRSLQRWNCPICYSINTAFEMYCTKCNSPRNTTINLPPLATEPDGSPPHTAEPELPFSDTLPAGRSDGRESEMNNSFIVIDDPQSEPPKTEKEIIDGPSVCIPLRGYVYPGEEELLNSIAYYANEYPGAEGDCLDELTPRPSAPIFDDFNDQSDYDYSFMQATQIEQLDSIREFISGTSRQDSEEMRFSLTASSKVEAMEKLRETTAPTHIPNLPSGALYPPLESIAWREGVYYLDPTAAHLTDSIPPIPHPRNISHASEQPIPAPRKTPQSSLVTPHRPDPEPMEIPPEPPVQLKRVISVHKEKIDTLAEEKLRVGEIISFLKEQKMNFIDPSFFPSPRSLFLHPQKENKDKLKMVTWLRPEEIRTHDRKMKWSVTNHPNPGDIYQGGLGNCWFLSALSVVAEKQKLIDNLLITKETNKQGIYQVCLCMCGKWEVVTIDDSFPCRRDNRTPLYSGAVRNQLWVCLIEKAAAKLYGCYESLNRGTLIEGLSTLTGAPCETIYFAELLHGRRVDPVEAKKIIWAQIAYFKKADFLMGVSTGNQEISKEVYQGVGLSPYHAYSVLNLSEMEGNRLLCLRDPHGSSLWKGDWSNKSPKWTKEMRKMLTPAEGGVFWISLDDLCNYFTAIDVCKVKLDYNEARESAVFPPFLECHTPVYLLELFDNTELDVCLYQPNKRYRENDKNESVVDFAEQPTDLSVILLKAKGEVETKKGSSAPNPSHLAGFIGRRKQACVSQSFKLEPGHYIIVPQAFSHWGSGYIIPYTIATFSSNAHLLESRPSRPGFFIEALFILVKAKGRVCKTGCNSNIVKYRLYDNFLGDISIVENNSNFHFHIMIDGSKCHNVVSTRGSITTEDWIPPKHKQIINILTYDNLSHGCGIDYKEMFSTSSDNAKGGYGSMCQPELTDMNRELHSPVHI